MSLTYPEDRSYHSEHLWAKAEPDGTMLVGITDYAQDQLGGVIFVDLPTVGEHFKQGVSCASIESVKITSDAIIPVSGEIVAVNEALADAPELLNDSPYDKGWLVRVKPDDADEGGRISAAEYARAGWIDIFGEEEKLSEESFSSPSQTTPPLQRLLRLLNPCSQRSLRQQIGDSFA